jgi:hypothetical protein
MELKIGGVPLVTYTKFRLKFLKKLVNQFPAFQIFVFIHLIQKVIVSG